MAKGYGQYCPLSLATEVLGQRWMILVISRIIDGCHTFSEIHRGVPRISPSLLSSRLEELEQAGLITKSTMKRGPRYDLTEAGKDLEDLIFGLAIWGQKWARDMCHDDLDPAFLAWSMHTRINASVMPPGRTVVEFELSGYQGGRVNFWIINENGKIEMCLKHPGYDTDLLVHSDIRHFIETWRGFRNLREEIQDGRIQLSGPSRLKSGFPDWLLGSSLAQYERKRKGKEYHLWRQSIEQKNANN